MKKQKWDKPISRRGFTAICKKLKTWESKYGFIGVRWAVNKYIQIRNQTVQREKHIKSLESELQELKKKEI